MIQKAVYAPGVSQCPRVGAVVVDYSCRNLFVCNASVEKLKKIMNLAICANLKNEVNHWGSFSP